MVSMSDCFIVCSPGWYTEERNAEETIVVGDVKKTLVTISRIRSERSQGKWVTFDKNGEFIIHVPYAGSKVLVPISFCTIDDIRHVLSYRWAGAYGHQPLQQNDAPIDFLRISATEKVWVDYLNHLNDEDLKRGVIESMGTLYSSRPVYAKYLHDFSPSVDCKGLSTMLSCITRGWIWQEIAFTDSDVVPENASSVRLLVELIKTGSEFVRGIMQDGFNEPKEKNVNEVIKFAIDCLWRARNLASNESAYIFFIENAESHKLLIEKAMQKVIKYRDGADPVCVKLLAALDNLENANFSRVEDSFAASFCTLLQSNTDTFGPIPNGKLAPDNFHITVTDMLRKVTRENKWDVEWWQQCVVDHPVSQLNHPKFESVIISPGTCSVIVAGKTYDLELCYNRPLQGQELDVSDKNEDGTHEILSLSYRITNGELFVVGFQTTSSIRFVPIGGLRVTEDTVEAVKDPTKGSRWTQTTWYSRDADWLNVLKRWKSFPEKSIQSLREMSNCRVGLSSKGTRRGNEKKKTDSVVENAQLLKQAGFDGVTLVKLGGATGPYNVIWKQINKKRHGKSSENYYMFRFGKKGGEVIGQHWNVFVAAKVAASVPDEFAPSKGLRLENYVLHFGHVASSDNLFFVVHPTEWGPFQRRFVEVLDRGKFEHEQCMWATECPASPASSLALESFISDEASSSGEGVSEASSAHYPKLIGLELTDGLSGQFLRPIIGN